MTALPEPSKVESLFLRLFDAQSVPKKTRMTRADLRARFSDLERGVITRGTLAGLFSGLAATGSVFAAETMHQSLSQVFNCSENTAFYCIALGLTTITTCLEILFLYIDGIKACARMSQIAQNEVFLMTETISALNQALVRAGLELASSKKPFYGIDPLINRSPIQLLLFSLAYKLKVTATNAILKFTVRRFFPKLTGRTLGRSIIEMVSIPVFALWNFYLCRRIMKQARVRTLGPLMVEDTFDAFTTQEQTQISEGHYHIMYAALREVVICCGAFHFNHVLFAQRLMTQTKPQESSSLELTSILQAQSLQSQETYLNLIALLLVSDGTLSRRKIKWFAKLQRNLAEQAPKVSLQTWHKTVCEGLPISLHH